MVRFSTVIFWLSFISDTDSVGTTICLTARCCPSETTRCSRLCLTLFSWPEYVLTTYQRNIALSFGGRAKRPAISRYRACSTRLLEDEVHQPRRGPVRQPEVEAGDDHEAD